MRFLRGHAHFLLKQLFKNIVFCTDENLDEQGYALLSNTTYTNDEGWQKIAEDFKFAYDNLPTVQEDKGRPTKAAAAAYLAKTCLYRLWKSSPRIVYLITKEDTPTCIQTEMASACSEEPVVPLAEGNDVGDAKGVTRRDRT